MLSTAKVAGHKFMLRALKTAALANGLTGAQCGLLQAAYCTQVALLKIGGLEDIFCSPALAHGHESTARNTLPICCSAAETSQQSCKARRRQATRHAALDLGHSADMLRRTAAAHRRHQRSRNASAEGKLRQHTAGLEGCGKPIGQASTGQIWSQARCQPHLPGQNLRRGGCRLTCAPGKLTQVNQAVRLSYTCAQMPTTSPSAEMQWNSQVQANALSCQMSRPG